MTYTQLACLHLATVLPASVLGALQFLRCKGSPDHKRLGKIYMLLMPAQVGQQFLHHFGFIPCNTSWIH